MQLSARLRSTALQSWEALTGLCGSEPSPPTHGDRMPNDIDDLLLAGDSTIEDLMTLAKKLPNRTSPGPRSRRSHGLRRRGRWRPERLRREGGQGSAEDGEGAGSEAELRLNGTRERWDQNGPH